MTSLAVFGATGNLGRYVVQQALNRGWQVSAVARSRSKLAPEIGERARVTIADLATIKLNELAELAGGCDAMVCCAGIVTEGDPFTSLIDRIVSAVESVPIASRPVSWFMGGAALLELDGTGRRGVDLPKLRGTYWPHRVNYERLQRSGIDWRLLCPGPMVHQPGLGADRLRISTEKLPSPLPAISRHLPSPLLLPLLAMKIPEMIIPYEDAASVMLSNISADSPMSRKRVGVALPLGMRGKKDHWVAKSSAA